MFWSAIAHAQEAAGGAQQPSLLEGVFPFVIMFAIFYFFIIRPQSNRTKKHQEFVSELKRGDSVLTASGIMGTIEGLTDTFVTLEVADGVRIRILRSQIQSPVEEEK